MVVPVVRSSFSCESPWEAAVRLHRENAVKSVSSASAWSPPLVSVVLCCHNGAATLGDQLAALSRQTYRGRWELVFVDDCSRDESCAIAESWADRLPIRIVRTNIDGEA